MKISAPRGRILILVVTLFVLCAFALWFSVRKTQRVEFPDGLSLEWLGVTDGTNVLLEGSIIEQLLGDKIPVKGIELFGFNLRRPLPLRTFDEERPVTAWIRLRGPDLNANQFKYYWEGSRVVASNKTGRGIENPPVRPFGPVVSNSIIVYVALYAFPRDERTVQIRISPPPEDGKEPRWAEFSWEHPFYGRRSNWTVGPVPITNSLGEHEFILKSVRSDPPEVVFRLPSAEWYLAECSITDDEGNRTTRTGSTVRNTSSAEQTVEFVYGLEERPWKISGTFVGASSSLLMNTSEQKASAAHAGERFKVQLEANGESWLTNSMGVRYHCLFDGQTLSIGEAGSYERPYFVLLSATNELGNRVKFGNNLSWHSNGSEMFQTWWNSKPSTSLVVELTQPKVIKTEFFVQPERKH